MSPSPAVTLTTQTPTILGIHMAYIKAILIACRDHTQ